MYPNYYGNQLNEIIGYQEDIYAEQQEINQNLEKINTSLNIIIVALALSFTLGIIRHILAR